MEHGENNLETVIIDQMRIQRRYGYRFVKRGFDILASLMGLILLSPLFLIVAIAIKVDDPRGKVFYSQIRLGRDERPFRMFKFRSMVSNADKLMTQLTEENEVTGAMFKMREDPRVTRVGRIIRKYSIDELPQLINVVIGSMSLVGPRPPLPQEVSKYTEYDKQRLLIKPGCTGLWQATVRNGVGFDEMVRLDLIYVKRQSSLYDLWILLLTVKIVLKPNNAY
ncbi:sugar transferase [Lactiplantibacillus argentoratensis]|jgi:lipopolysaccharide/colanic/teichoic acid biosynthesis glycosyltransferase|uniref:sugar transferase n=1 Tax=Lactiplantibacillus argentoratensis TaxID=271881 RepID=UPI001BDCDD55|nr:sugar transferase [Lactiplantibacillus argentoratensis]MBT1142301.1 sugar transferase [Lactiplantibacillus argentoratensis]MBT1145122.1 sugar transferase [Lactiplantibacillus argentoratensis]MBT1147994.1 sugar transferase [Lactiplantibacillus argentoratensis]MBT1153839.1 sugar transferase [Lactiplantibacillus argentoratensis]MCA5599138.1 sugar transferase [Lactiplantibacillus argentoratensis]